MVIRQDTFILLTDTQHILQNTYTHRVPTALTCPSTIRYIAYLVQLVQVYTHMDYLDILLETMHMHLFQITWFQVSILCNLVGKISMGHLQSKHLILQVVQQFQGRHR